MKTHPWELTQKEWYAERDRIRPCTAATRFHDGWRHSASEAVKNSERLQWLLFGVTQDASDRLNAASRHEIQLTPEEVDDLLDRVNTRVTHRDVINKALREGWNVPIEVLSDYPDLIEELDNSAKEHALELQQFH